MDFWTRLDAVRSEWNVLEHSFYRRWSAGELSAGELAAYRSEESNVPSLSAPVNGR